MTAAPLDISEIKTRRGAIPKDSDLDTEITEENEPASPDRWRLYWVGDNSYEATLCELWSGEHNNKAWAEFIKHSPADIAALLAEVDRLQALLSTAYEDAVKVVMAKSEALEAAAVSIDEKPRRDSRDAVDYEIMINRLRNGASDYAKVAHDIRVLAAKNGAVR